MAKFRVTVTRVYHSTHEAMVVLEAESEDDAVDDAKQLDCDGELPWELDYTWDDEPNWQIEKLKE